MPILKNASIFYLKANPQRPNTKFNKENPTWEVQLRTTNVAQRKEWEALNLPVKAVVPDDGAPYWRVNLKKKKFKRGGTEPSSFVEVVNGAQKPIDPDTVGNESIGNVRIFQYEYDKKAGGKATASVLMGIQLTKHIKYKPPVRDDNFADEETEVVELDDDDEQEAGAAAPAAVDPSKY